MSLTRESGWICAFQISLGALCAEAARAVRSSAFFLAAALLLGGCSGRRSGEVAAMRTVTLDRVFNGSLRVKPAVESGSSWPEGTKFTLEAVPDAGYVLDSLYRSHEGQWGTMYDETMSARATVVLTGDARFGAAFLRADELDGIEVIQDIRYAKPGAKALKYDIFKPKNARDLPLVVIIHGGGLSSNDENIMRGMAREIARTGRYVAASVDYRWIGNLDGDARDTRVRDIVGDVYGALAHIQERAASYGADPSRIAVTGDSAGAYLCASVATMVESGPPSYMPTGMGVAELRRRLSESIKVAAPSYGGFSGELPSRFEGGDESAFQAMSPIANIPSVAERKIPHYLVRGTADPLISYEMVKSYADALLAAGQSVKRVEVEGAGHAFLDWKPDAVTRRSFAKYGIPCIADMLSFMDEYL